MRKARITHLLDEYVVPAFPGYQRQETVLYRVPLVDVLRGYCFDPERGPDMLYVWVFVQPLYVPKDHFVLTIGQRIASRQVTLEGEAEIVEGIVRTMKDYEVLLERLRDAASLAHDERVVLRYEPSYDANRRQVSAFSQVMAGDFEGGRANLDSLRDYLNKQLRGSSPSPWLSKLDEQAAALQGALKQDRRQAIAMLNDWTVQTKRNLKLPLD